MLGAMSEHLISLICIHGGGTGGAGLWHICMKGIVICITNENQAPLLSSVDCDSRFAAVPFAMSSMTIQI